MSVLSSNKSGYFTVSGSTPDRQYNKNRNKVIHKHPYDLLYTFLLEIESLKVLAYVS